MAFDMETFDMSCLRALRDANGIEQLIQAWSKDKNHGDSCYDLEYEAGAVGPGYVWIDWSENQEVVSRVRADVELGVLLKHIFDELRPARPLAAACFRNSFWGGRVADPHYKVDGIPFLKMRLCDLARTGRAFQILVDI
jgi:hypothetical protein